MNADERRSEKRKRVFKTNQPNGHSGALARLLPLNDLLLSDLRSSALIRG
jgi:hypothetical protein